MPTSFRVVSGEVRQEGGQTLPRMNLPAVGKCSQQFVVVGKVARLRMSKEQ